MQLAKRIDLDGFFIEDVLDYDIDNLQSDLILDDVPQGLHRPKWDGTQWVEGKPQVEIEAVIAQRDSDLVKSELRDIDLASIRGLREWLASQPNPPQFVVDLEAQAVEKRARIK